MRVKLVISLLLISISLVTFGQRRIVLLEQFTNASCPPCSENMPRLHDYIKHHFGFVPLQFHAWWPGSDPMYDHNIDQNTDRINYYGVWGVPWIYIDGIEYGEPLNMEDIHNHIQERMNEPAICYVDIGMEKTTDNVDVDVTLIATDTPQQTNLKLRVAIIEREIFYDVGPGSIPSYNNFGAVMRQILPSAEGEPIDFMAKNDTLNFQFSTPTDAEWNFDELYAVAWLQSDDTKEVLQSNINFPLFVVESNDPQQDFMSPNSNYSKGYTITNENDTPLNVRIKPLVHSNDGNWVVKITKGGVLYDSLDVSVDPGRTTDFRLSVTTSNTQGEIKLDVCALNLDDPHGYGNSVPYYGLLASSGALYVDDDDGAQSETRYLGVLDDLNIKHSVVEKEKMLPLFSTVDSLPFDFMIWGCGNAPPSFDTNDVNIMMNFMDKGGNLMMAGQQIANEVWEPDGLSNIAEVQTFFNEYMDAQYIQANSEISSLSPVEGNPFAEDLTFSLNTLYTNDPDAYQSFSKNNSELLFYTGSEMYGALAFTGDNFKSALLGFGIEQIIPRSKGNLLLTRILEFFDIATDIGEEGENIPLDYSLSQNYPNPFNPNTTITYSLPENVFVSLKVYDITGREIAELVNGEKTAGNYSIDFSAENLSSGIYFYTLISGSFSDTKKMIVLK